MIILFLFTVKCFEECRRTIEVDIGINHYSYSMEENDIICINSSNYPYFVVFKNYSQDVSFWTSFMITNESYTPQKKESLVRFAQFFLNFTDPFHKVYLHAKAESYIEFSTVFLPGYCTDGIFFATESKVAIRFEGSGSKFFNFEFGSDKCIVYLAKETQNITATFETPNFDNSILFYHNYTTFTSLNTNSTVSVLQNDDNSTIFLRILIDSINIPKSLRIILQSNSLDNYAPQSGYFDPEYIINSCPRKPLENDKIAISVLVLIIVLVILDFYFISLLCFKPETEENQYVEEDESLISITSITPSSKFTISRFSNNDLIFFPH